MLLSYGINAFSKFGIGKSPFVLDLVPKYSAKFNDRKVGVEGEFRFSNVSAQVV